MDRFTRTLAPLPVALLVTLVIPSAGAGQSLLVREGERAVEAAVAWSVGPFSNGVETHAALSLHGRWDVGVGFNRYAADLGGSDDTTLSEWTPFVRYFLSKEDDDGTPVSFAAHAAFFVDDFEGGDDGWYTIAGGQLYKRLRLSERLALYPMVGFFLAVESSTFGQSGPTRSAYLTRQFGVQGQIGLSASAWLRLSAEEHSFRRETYRAVRAAYVRRF